MQLAELFLTEAQDYLSMLNPVLRYCTQLIQSLYAQNDDTAEHTSQIKRFEDAERQLQQEFEGAILWAKRTLKKKDAITWFLRLKRLEIFFKWGFDDEAAHKLIHQMEGECHIKVSDTWDDLEAMLEHYLGLPIPQIQRHRFNRDNPDTLFKRWAAIEKEWAKTRHQLVTHQKHHEVLYDFNDGWVWMDLKEKNCDHEADAMGHCGNRWGDSDDTLLSLRKKQPDGSWRPSLTFVLDKNGLLGEMKGRANEKPAEKYHEMIMTLLLQPCVKGIKGGGYEPQNNFEITDLTPEQRAMIYEKKPELMPLSVYLEKHGPDEKFRAKAIAQIEALNSDWIKFYKRHWQEVYGEWRFVYDTADYWTEFVSTYGTDHVKRLVSTFGEGSPDVYVEQFRGWVESVGGDLPQAYIDALLDYVWKECEDDIKTTFHFEDQSEFDEREMWRFMEDEEEPSDILTALGTAHYRGVETGAENKLGKVLEGLLEDFDHFKVGEAPDGRWQLYLDPANVAELIEEGAESIENNEVESGQLDVADQIDLDGYDKEAAIEAYKEEAPDEVLPKAPEFTPVDDMTMEQCKIEYEELTGHDLDRYSADQLELARTVLERARQSYWGKS